MSECLRERNRELGFAEQEILMFRESALWTELLIRPNGIAPGHELEAWIASRSLDGSLCEIDLQTVDLSLQLLNRRPAGSRISTNISIDMLDRPEQRDRLMALVEEKQSWGRVLVLEISELFQLPSRLDTTIESIECLRAMGIQIAIDDFGRGADRTSLLLSGQADWIKLDRTLSDQKLRPRVSILVEYLKKLEVRVVAEGLEDTAGVIWAMNRCDAGQGFAIGHPSVPEVSSVHCWAPAGDDPCQDPITAIDGP